MTPTPQPAQPPVPEYGELLAEYLSDGSELGLAAAYEWGRVAMDEGRSIQDVVATHERSFAAWRRARRGHPHASVHEAAARFLAESLAPYEMARRGVHDAVLTLRRLNEALEQEAQRIARAVHDEAGQLAVVLQLSLAELARELPPEAAAALRPVHATLDQVESHLRRLSHELRPSLLDDLGWLPAVRWLAQGISARNDVKITVSADTDLRLPAPMELAVYRVVQEALTNVARHARAASATVTVATTAAGLTVTVADDGVGFDVSVARPQHASRGLGLLGMRERLAAIGGALQLESRVGQGTRLTINVPVEGWREAAADTR